MAVPKQLYSRWQRPGSLTRSAQWNHFGIESNLATLAVTVPLAWNVLRDAATTDAETFLGQYCLRLFARWFYQLQQANANDCDRADPTLDHPLLATATRDAALAACDDELTEWIGAMEDLVASIEAGIFDNEAAAK